MPKNKREWIYAILVIVILALMLIPLIFFQWRPFGG